MIGLTYIREMYNLSLQELAKKVEVSKQTVFQWEKEQIKISKKRLDQLSNEFNIPKEYFSKELTALDTLKIQQFKLKAEMININSNDESLIYKSSNINALIGIWEIREKVDRLFDDSSIDFVNGITYLNILKNIEIIIRLEKINPSTLNDMLSTILYNMVSVTEYDSYVKSFKTRGIPDYQIKFEKKLLDLLSKYEIERDEDEKEDDIPEDE